MGIKGCGKKMFGRGKTAKSVFHCNEYHLCEECKEEAKRRRNDNKRF